ncbi:hypothetical protein RCH14_001412 [Massilia sp. MP_M2]|uniref:hypothetical protein n=1 Tax=Massilia sp. MP_M2 TaxID=3071713 RepID=UPI00319E0F81
MKHIAPPEAALAPSPLTGNESVDDSASAANVAADAAQSRSMHRTAASRAVGQASRAATAKTAKGKDKDSTGSPQRPNASQVSAWKKENKASIAETAKHFNLPPTIAKRWCAVA